MVGVVGWSVSRSVGRSVGRLVGRSVQLVDSRAALHRILVQYEAEVKQSCVLPRSVSRTRGLHGMRCDSECDQHRHSELWARGPWLKICLSPRASRLEQLLAAHARQGGTKQVVRSRLSITQNENVRQHIRVRGRQERRPRTMTHPILQARAALRVMT